MQPRSQKLSHIEYGKIQSKHPDIIRFLNQQLRSTAGFSIQQEYPSLFGEYPGGFSQLARMNGRIVSHVGYVVREMHSAHYRMKIGIIGSVSTDPVYRNKGVASLLLQRTIRDLRAKGCAIAILWSDKEDYYRTLGFYRAGQEIDFRFNAEEVPEVTKVPVLFDPNKHAHYIWRLYQKHDVKLDRSLEEQRKLFAVPRVRIYVTLENEIPTSYVVINKGADFKDFIHEWGGKISDVQSNVAWLQKHLYPNVQLTLIAPAHYCVEPIRQIASVENHGALGLIKLLDRKQLVEHYSNFLTHQRANFSLSKDGTQFKYEGIEYAFDSDEHCTRVVFGTDGKVKQPVLPLFLWGFDSI